MKQDKFITDFEDIPTPRQKMPHLSLEERRLNFKEVELGFTEQLALRETSRCLSCRKCIGCGLCLAECDQQAIAYDQKEQYLSLSVDAVIVAGGIEPFDARRKPEFGYAYYPNVITNIEFERILNANGPFAGIVMRPSDGEIPQRIAFIQCVGSRDEGLGVNYCSNLCCVTTLKQAIQAISRANDIEVTIYYRDLRPFSREGESLYLKASDEYGIQFIAASVERLEEDPQTDNIIVNYRQGEASFTANHDLVVLATGITTSAEFKRLSRQVGARLNKYGFFPNTIAAPFSVPQEGVWLAGSITRPMDLSISLAHASAVAAQVMQTFTRQELTLTRIAPLESPSATREFKDGTAIFFCRYGLNSNFLADADTLLKSVHSIRQDVVISDLEYACNTTGKRKIVEVLDQHRPRKIIIAPCYARKNHLAMFQKLASSLGYSADQIVVLDIETNVTADNEALKQKLLDLIEINALGPAAVIQRTSLIPHAAVVGDSLAAVQTALDIANQGFDVSLLSPRAEFGAHDRQIFWFVSEIDLFLNDRIAQVKQHPRIKIYQHCQIKKIEQFDDNQRLSFICGDGEQSLDVGAIVVAPSAQGYQPVEFHYGHHANIFTQLELTQRLGDQSFSPQKIVMIQCIGSRQPERPYCSLLCCQSAIHNAVKLKNSHPQAEIFILHRDIRVYDFEEDNYAEALEKGIQFIRMDREPAVEIKDGIFDVHVMDRVSKQTIQLTADCLVLSNGIIPPPENKSIAAMLNLPIETDGFLGENKNVIVTSQTNPSAIFVAGLAHSPQRIEDILVQATAIAGKVGLLFRNGNNSF